MNYKLCLYQCGNENSKKEIKESVVLKLDMIGEGLCWVGHYKDSRYVFKVKGEKHSSSKVKKLAHVDIEKMNSIEEFVNYAVTENRLNQAIEQVFTSTSIQPSQKGTGDFLRWMVKDVMKEETDTMVKNGLEPKDVNKYISEKARRWFFTKLDEDAFDTK